LLDVLFLFDVFILLLFLLLLLQYTGLLFMERIWGEFREKIDKDIAGIIYFRDDLFADNNSFHSNSLELYQLHVAGMVHLVNFVLNSLVHHL